MKLPLFGRRPAPPVAGKTAEQKASDPFTEIGVEDAKKLFDSGVTVIDVREQWEYNSGHVPGARHAPLQTFLRQPQQYLPEGAVLFVCAVGERSAVACEMAAALGQKPVYNLNGGTNAWVHKGYPVET